MFLRRLLPVVTMLSLLLTCVPAPAQAMTAQQEVQMGRQEDEQIVRSSVIETDPLLNRWVNHVAQKLWQQVARKELPYNVKIINAPDINAFSTMGGYVYVDEGLLDFVQSSDELAGVLGHETGHIERNHVISMQSKETVLNALFTIASLFSPLIYQFGNLAEAGIVAKLSRDDELQADRYGLQLMARAGYDPQAMLSMMRHLGTLEAQHSDLITKYLADHPPATVRLEHLVGYPELDPTKVTPQQRLVQALSDADRARYSIAASELSSLLPLLPNNQEALLKLGQMQLALGLTSKSEQTLEEAASVGDPQAKQLALSRLAAVQQLQVQSVDLLHPHLTPLRESLAEAKTQLEASATNIAARAAEGRNQLKALQSRMTALNYDVPNIGNVQVRPGSRLAAISNNIEAMGAALNLALSNIQAVVGNQGVGSLDPKKTYGVLEDQQLILRDLAAPLKESPIPSTSAAIFSDYPTMLAELSRSQSDMLGAVDASRAAELLLDGSIGRLDEFFRQFVGIRLNFNGDLNKQDYDALLPYLKKSLDSVNAAAVAASKADQLFNMARSRQLSARITMLGVGSSPQRYASLRYALKQRFGNTGISYGDMLKDHLTPGEVTTASILAADKGEAIRDVIADAKAKGLPLVDEANAQDMHAWPLEIFMGLTYLDYTDNPQREISGG